MFIIMYYCEFDETGSIFNQKKVYKCKHCGITLALDTPNDNIICFYRQNAFIDSLYSNQDNKLKSQYLNKDEKIIDATKRDLENEISKINLQAQKNSINQEFRTEAKEEKIEKESGLCSKEQIESRLSICQSCEYFKDNSCLMCGCVVVREKNFNNKLAHKGHSCPVNKWGPIID